VKALDKVVAKGKKIAATPRGGGGDINSRTAFTVAG
jgi:hypothetical protein